VFKENLPLGRRTFTWRDGSYRLDSSTWLFWGRGRLIQLPGDGSEFRMTPDEALFVRFAVKAGFEPGNELDEADLVEASCAHLAQHGYQVWTASEALQVVRDDADEALATRLMERLIHWYFLAPY
tara:strand:+ start:9357 stop:9731 length:375 start_codon:yes stop_codon:yes gene_type:complete